MMKEWKNNEKAKDKPIGGTWSDNVRGIGQ
jgi:hypothetical protein